MKYTSRPIPPYVSETISRKPCGSFISYWDVYSDVLASGYSAYFILFLGAVIRGEIDAALGRQVGVFCCICLGEVL